MKDPLAPALDDLRSQLDSWQGLSDVRVIGNIIAIARLHRVEPKLLLNAHYWGINLARKRNGL